MDYKAIHKYDTETKLYLESYGYKVYEVYECKWKEFKRKHNNLQKFLDDHLKVPLQSCKRLTGKALKDAIVRNPKVFGFVRAKLYVPREKYDYFADLTPLFVHKEISFNEISPYSQKLAAQNHAICHKPVDLLIGSYSADNVLISTDLFRWYVKHGLVVEKIYEFGQYKSAQCFLSIANYVMEMRVKAADGPYKLIGNSFFGIKLRYLRFNEV